MPEWKISDTLTSDAYFQIVAGGNLHPETQRWQLWVTFDGDNINWVAAYNSEERIEQHKQELRKQIQPGEKWNRQRATALLDALYEQREFEPQPMPQHIEAMIRHNFVWR